MNNMSTEMIKVSQGRIQPLVRGMALNMDEMELPVAFLGR